MKRTSRRIGSGFQLLEEKLLCAGDVYLSGHELHVRGTNIRDVFTATQSESGLITVYDRGTPVFVVDAFNVDRAIVELYDGNDVAKFFVTVPVYVYAGAGDDTVITGTNNDLIDGGSGQDSVRGGLGSDTFRMKDGDYDRVFNVTANDVLIGEHYNFAAWHRFLSTPNVNAYRGNRITVTREYVDGYGDDRLFYTVDVDARNGHFENYGELQQMAVGNPAGESPGGLRLYIPIGGEARFVGFDPRNVPYSIQVITVM